MNNRKLLFGCIVVTVTALYAGLFIWSVAHGYAHRALWWLPFLILKTSFMFPGDWLAGIGQSLGHDWWGYSFPASCLFWFFPIARVRRCFGRHDAFRGTDVSRPGLVRMIARGLDALDRRRFGREKTGRWA